jgi:ribosome assembly protein RRB1
MRVGKKNQAQISILAHNSDVNVISWNYLKPNLLASGSDDGSFKIWDLKAPKNAIAEILWHSEPITSIHFQPNDESVLAVSSADNRLGIWDFAVEADDQGRQDEDEMEEEVPDQLMFLHQGQEDIKEIRFN